MSSLIPYAVMVSGIIILASHGMSRMILCFAEPPSTVHMRAVVTLMILASALYVLVFTDDQPQWATGALGTILGYWLPRE